MATRVISEATANGDVVAVNFLIAEKYIAALHALAQSPNQKLVIVPMELSSLAGTLGGLSQIAASAMGSDIVAPPRPPARPRPPGPVPNTSVANSPPVSPWQGSGNASPGGGSS
jgi:C-terminal region of band_7